MESLDKKLQGIQLVAQEKLQALLCSIPGKKDLIIAATIIKSLEHICNASWLKLKGIQKIYKFDAQNIIPHTTDHVQVFIIRSCIETFQNVLRHVHELQRAEQTKNMDATIKYFHIICVPSCYAYFHTLLEEEGLYGYVQLHRYNWDFIYIDENVLSLEVPNVFSSVFLHGDSSPLPAIAQSIRLLQMICGRPELILTYGEHATSIVNIIDALPSWCKQTEQFNAEFSAMIIIDRDKDYASSLLTPAIYAGLLMEVFNSRTGEIVIEPDTNKISRQKLQIFQLPTKQVQKAQPTNEKSMDKPPTIRLNSLSDEIYGENRYKHFAQAISLIRAQAKAIGLEVQKLNDMKLDEIHDYVARKLPKITELKMKVMRHLNASEKVIEMLASNFRKLQTLEENILNNVSRKRILEEIDFLLTADGQRCNTIRLLCLLHLCSGLGADELQQFMRNYCNYFGAQHLHVFALLANAGLLPALQEEKMNKSTKLLSNLPIPKFQQTEFQANANRMKLLTTTAGAEATNNPVSAASCPSYVFNNVYVPLAAQLCSLLLKSNNADDFVNKLGMMDKINLFAYNTQSNAYSMPLNIKSYANNVKQNDLNDVFPLRKRKLFVYLVGGITYAEIGACDLIGKLTGAQIIVASDAIIAGTDLIASVF